MTDKTMDYMKLRRFADAFIGYEMVAHGEDPRSSLEYTILRKPKNYDKNEGYEGYKYRVKEIWHDILSSKTNEKYRYTEALRAMIGSDKMNLFEGNGINSYQNLIDETDHDLLEIALGNVFEGDLTEESFNEIVSVLNRNFPILGLVCFIKDPDHCMPISPQNFDNGFELLGLDSDLCKNCSWGKYRQYNNWLAEVQDFLQAYVNPEFTLIDAHSFMWRLLKGQFNNYLDAQLVQHIKFGVGRIREVKDDGDIKVVFKNKELTLGKEAWKNNKIARVRVDNLPVLSKEQVKIEAEMDSDLACELDADDGYESDQKPGYTEGPEQRPAPVERNGAPYFPRDPRKARNALCIAGYQCEVNKSHQTFQSRSTGKQYMEAHHLVPMGYQRLYSNSLDREQNILCLCSICHDQLHHGADVSSLVEQLYNLRHDLLDSAEIHITLEELLEMYGQL